MFEADDKKRRALYGKFPNADIRGKFVTYQNYQAELQRQLFVIDVDGIDSLIMQDVLASQGKHISILMVEHFDLCSPIRPTDNQPIPHWLLGQRLADGFNIQATESTLLQIANDYGFERVGVSRVNSIFVRGDLFNRLKRPLSIQLSALGT
jgi:hypothetical protein